MDVLVSIRENLINEATKANIRLSLAMGEAKAKDEPLTHDESRQARLTSSHAMVLWYRANCPEGGAEAFIEQAKKEGNDQ